MKTKNLSILTVITSFYACQESIPVAISDAHPENAYKVTTVHFDSSNHELNKPNNSTRSNSFTRTFDSNHIDFNIWDRYNPKDQSFMLSNTNDTIIYSQKGCKIYIPKQIFQDSLGNLYRGTLSFRVREYFSLPEIFSAGLSTVSNNRLIETGGMFYFSAFTESGSPLIIKKDNHFVVQIPTKRIKHGMQTFRATNDTSRVITWQPAQNTLLPEEFDSDARFCFSTRTEELLKKRTDHLYFSISENWDLCIDEKKSKLSFSKRGYSHSFPYQIIAAAFNEKPELLNFIRFNKRYELSITYEKNNCASENGIIVKYPNFFNIHLNKVYISDKKVNPSVYQDFEELLSFNRIQQKNDNQKFIVPQYTIKIEELGYTNCDRFLRLNVQKFMIPSNTFAQLTDAYIVAKKRTIILPVKNKGFYNDHILQGGLPEDDTYFLIATRYDKHHNMLYLIEGFNVNSIKNGFNFQFKLLKDKDLSEIVKKEIPWNL